MSESGGDRPPGPPRLIPVVWALILRELVRFLRQRSRVVGAVGQPVVFWLLFGAGLRGSFNAPAWTRNFRQPLSYQEYFLPGVAVLIVLFTAIFSTISIIEDRREGFLQGVLVAPVPRLAIVLSKVLAGAALAILQAGLFLTLGPVLSWIGFLEPFELSWTLPRLLVAAGFLILIAVELTALGVVIAWPLNSTQGYHAVMSLFLMPMWLVSGALFPGSGSAWLSWLQRVNPLTYGVSGLRRMLYAESLPVTSEFPSLAVSLLVTIVVAGALVAVACVLVSRPDVRNVS
jgi:ABC-2 type transport system permease protein